MHLKRMGLWVSSVALAAALGWFGAMAVTAGAPIADEGDAFLRFKNALTVNNSFARTETLLKLTKQLTPETLPGAIRAFREDVAQLHAIDIRMLMWAWAQEDPRGMVQAVQDWPDLRTQRLAASEAVAQIARQEGYDAAREFFDKLPFHQREIALPSLTLAHLEYGRISEIGQLIESHPPGNERDVVAAIVARQMFDLNGPEFTQQWVESLPPGHGSKRELKRVAFRAVQDAHLDTDHLDALERWLERVGDEPWTQGARRGIAVHWVKREPAAAIAWARELSAEQDRDEIVAETVRVFATLDPDGALAWLLEQEPDPTLDRGTGRLAVHFARRRPDTAIMLVERVLDAKKFATIEQNVKQEWRQLRSRQKRDEFVSKLDAIATARENASHDPT